MKVRRPFWVRVKGFVGRLFPPHEWSDCYFQDEGWACCERCGWPTLMRRHRLDDDTVIVLRCPNCQKIQTPNAGGEAIPKGR